LERFWVDQRLSLASFNRFRRLARSASENRFGFPAPSFPSATAAGFFFMAREPFGPISIQTYRRRIFHDLERKDNRRMPAFLDEMRRACGFSSQRTTD
jgi:hypothetical protein